MTSLAPVAHRRLSLPAVLVTVCCAVAGCGSDGRSTDGASQTANVPAGSATATESDSTENTAAVDACSLIAADDITALLGVPVQGRPTGTDPRLPGCIWENPANLESVSLEVGMSGTAANGTLPAPEPGFPDLTTPGPDGMRFLGEGSVEFPAAGRTNTVQVAVLSMLGDGADAAAVDLARKVGPQIPD